nr:OsmC family protein [Kibdelosporangium sp. MJ126-NF4]CEL21423.1 OsmC family protein [Kibdelosporangium sp. MJ126-NF4]
MSLTDVIDATRAATEADPKNAAAQFTVTHDLAKGTATVVDVRVRDHQFTVDEPGALGGTDTAANPVEYALASLGSCQVITYQFWAAKLHIPLDAVKVTVSGDIDLHGFFGFDDAVRPGFAGVHVDVELSGPADPAKYEELKRQVDEHCPVLDLFRNPTPTSTALTSD